MTLSKSALDPANLPAVNAEVERIQRHQQAGRYDESRRAIDALLDTYPDHPQLLHLRALNLVYEGDQDAGLALLKRVADNDPDNAIVRVDYGSFLARTGKLDDIPTLLSPDN